MITIALDAMGGDFFPDTNLEGALLAAKKLPIKIILVGDKVILEKKIKQFSNFPTDQISIHHADEIIEMTDSPSKAFRKKKNSSIHVGLNLVKENKAQAFVSAGNTGAVLTASTFILGRIEGVDRPVLTAVIPSEKKPLVMLDMGSNVDCKPSQLLQFAIMGECFSKEIMEVKTPKVGLLNIGEEKEKGNIITQQTHDLLEKINVNFIGNIEGKELTKGNVDVVVCDGFVGNNMLKFGEGIVKMFKAFFSEEAKRSLLSMIALLLLKPTFKRFKKKFDYDEYGGAHFLGVNGISIIAHGSASEIAIKNAINMAYQSVKTNMVSKIENALTKSELQNISEVTVSGG
ncbi:phosphate--acyl-ACP acyltransferase [bacterium]|nr:phosphate--acyl-ACP acyltransferase [bacterium]